MVTFVVVLHVIVGLALILIVLLQAGKGASMGAAFGGSSQTVFGSAGAGGFLSKLTTAVAVLFMITSLSLSTMFSKRTTSSMVTEEAGPVVEVPIPFDTKNPVTETQPAELENKEDETKEKN